MPHFPQTLVFHSIYETCEWVKWEVRSHCQSGFQHEEFLITGTKVKSYHLIRLWWVSKRKQFILLSSKSVWDATNGKWFAFKTYTEALFIQFYVLKMLWNKNKKFSPGDLYITWTLSSTPNTENRKWQN